jgi:hypothetical protein
MIGVWRSVEYYRVNFVHNVNQIKQILKKYNILYSLLLSSDRRTTLALTDGSS